MKKNAIKYLLIVTTLSCMLCGCGNTDKKTQTFGNSQSESEEDTNKKDAEDSADKNKPEEKKDSDEEADKKSDEEKKSEENEKSQNDDQGKKAAGNYEIALNGVLFTIPKTYDITIVEDTETVYINDEDYNFEMSMVVREDSYTEALKDKESLTENARKEDITIIKDITECEINGKSYAYFTFEFHDYDTVNTIAYTEGAGDKRIGMNIIINSDMTTEEVLEIVDTFLHDTKKTDVANTTVSDLSEMDQVSTGKALQETELKLGDKTYTVKVPDGYYYMDDHTSEGSYLQIFESENQKVSVNIMLMEEPYCGTAKEYVKSEAESIDESDSDYSEVKKSQIEQTEVNGNTVYYGTLSYVYNDGPYKKLFAACELPGGESYVMEVTTLYNEESVTFDIFEDFMDINMDIK